MASLIKKSPLGSVATEPISRKVLATVKSAKVKIWLAGVEFRLRV